MKKSLFLFSFLYCFVFGQSDESLNLHSPQNIKRFADYLMTENDYYRASLEYEKISRIAPDDTISYKIALAKSKGEQYGAALSDFMSLIEKRTIIPEVYLQYFKTLFMAGFDSTLIYRYENNFFHQVVYDDISRLYFLALLRSNRLSKDETLIPDFFDNEQKHSVSGFLERKINPGYKNPYIAALLSAVVPGAGKVYTGRYEEGITALNLTSVFAYLSYSSFEADHKVRGWLFAGTSFLFYTGNVYGSAASAQIHNAAMNLKFDTDFNFYLKSNNYLIKKESGF
jgi:TM2 domain-containing membrane protein YozV